MPVRRILSLFRASQSVSKQQKPTKKCYRLFWILPRCEQYTNIWQLCNYKKTVL